MKSARSASRAFTLIELMMVVAILGVAMAMGYPSIAKALHRAPLSQAVWDVMEECRQARRHAILFDQVMELDIYADHVAVVPSPADGAPAVVLPSRPVLMVNVDQPKPGENLSATFSDKVAISELRVNLIEVGASDSAARVRFYPNGTCDELTMELFCDGEKRRITLESVTALAGVEMVQ